MKQLSLSTMRDILGTELKPDCISHKIYKDQRYVALMYSDRNKRRQAMKVLAGEGASLLIPRQTSVIFYVCTLNTYKTYATVLTDFELDTTIMNNLYTEDTQ